MTPTLVRCVNCGAGDTSWPTILALVFAGVAAAIAARALYLQTAEARRLRHELLKRADFRLTIRPAGPMFSGVTEDAAECVVDASMVILRFEVGISNTGDKAASHAALNVVVPARFDGFTWTGPTGEAVGPDPIVAPTSEELPGESDGRGSQWIGEEIERVALRTPHVRWVRLQVSIPPKGGVNVPVRVRVESDDLPDDVEERVKDFIVRVRRGRSGE
jgi:hypothetical protein